MPIKLPENLPAFNILKNEGVSVLSDVQASRQDIRPLRLALLNLMPKKNSNRKPIFSINRFNSTTD